MKLKWLSRARNDLIRQIDYITDRNPMAGADMLVTLRTAVRRLQDFAYSGRLGRQKGNAGVTRGRNAFHRDLSSEGFDRSDHARPAWRAEMASVEEIRTLTRTQKSGPEWDRIFSRVSL